MGIASLLVGIVAILLMFGGFVFAIVPVVGSIFSFAAPVVALVGIVLGGIAISRARREGEATGLATAGLVVSILAFFPALLVALTCGLCNAVFTAGMMNPQKFLRDGSMPPMVAPALDAGAPDASNVGEAGVLGPDAGALPPPAFPPPPVGEPKPSGASNTPPASDTATEARGPIRAKRRPLPITASTPSGGSRSP